jgi:hypothetical protein
MSNTPKIGDGAAKTIAIIFFFLVFFIAKYWYVILPVVAVIAGIFLYMKLSHHDLQRRSLEVDIRHKENEIDMSQKEMELRQLELKAQLMDLQSKMEKRGARAEQINLTNQAMRQKLDKSNFTDYKDQLNDLQ